MLTESSYPQLAEQHTDALALNWQRREALLRSTTKDFGDLRRSDQRLASHLNALLRLGDTAHNKIRACLDEPLTRGEHFALTCYAMTCDDLDLIEAAHALARSLPHFEAGLLAAIDWQEDPLALAKHIGALPPELQLRALAANAVRIAPDPDVHDAIERRLYGSELDPGYIKAGLSLARSLADTALARTAERHLGHERPDVRLSAAQTILRLARPEYTGAGIETLRQLLRDETSAEIPPAALRTLALHAPAHAQASLADLASNSAAGRLVVMAQGWIGRISAVPELSERLLDPVDARQAAAAITLITGADPLRDGWQAEAPLKPADVPDSETDTLARIDPDAELPWPAQERFVAWWAQHRARFSANETYLYGEPVSSHTLARHLRSGPLAVRPLAAERLQRRIGGATFPTRLPAHQQQSRFTFLSQETARD